MVSSVSNNGDDYDKSDWFMADEEWMAPWGGTRSLWLTSIFPRIGQFLPADRIVQIGCGYGKIAKMLHAFSARELVLFDTSDACIEKCALKFEESSKTRCLKTDGHSLQGVADNSVDLVFSFHSLVGVDAETMQAYLRECGRVLRNDGAAFLHHSNFGMYYKDESIKIDERLRSLADYRDTSIDAEGVQEMAGDNDLICIRQECINWDIEDLLSDCFSTLVRPGSKWVQKPVLIHNLEFLNERNRSAKWAHEKRIRPDNSWGLL